jgi:NADH-quinone oxidoreductase subunit J
MLHLALFLIFGALALGAALNLLIQRHPIDSALSLIVVMGSLAVEYLLLGAEFVAAIQVIVYAGAIMVLFIFVIMLLNAGVEERTAHASRVAYLFGLPGMVLGGVIVAWVLINRDPASNKVIVGELYGSGADIGRLIFRPYLLPFEITSVLVLIAIMGAVVLARRDV